jgi:hypothetical protein
MSKLEEHLKSRYLDLSHHKVWLDEDEYCATFPLWNLSGHLVGYQTYRPNGEKVQKNDLKGRYYTYRNKDAVSVWGLESWDLSKTLFVVEGIFNATRLTSMGYSCVALLSNNPNKSTKRWLWTIRQMRHVVAVCDPGAGGKYLKSLGHEYVVCDVDEANGVDLGDAPQWWVDKLLEGRE